MIKTIEIEGYRLLDQFKANLGPLTVVIGANATGKSTLQDFLGFLSSAMQRPLNTVLAERGGIGSVLTANAQAKHVGWRITFARPATHPYWSVAFPFDESVQLEYSARLSGEIPLYGAVPRFELLRAIRDNGASQESLTLLEYRDGISSVYDNVLGCLADFREPAQRQRDLFSDIDAREGRGGLSTRQPGGQATEAEAEAEGPSLLLAQVRFPGRFATVSSLRSFLASSYLYRVFDVSPRSLIRLQPADVAPTTRLWPEGWNLATVLNTILSKRDYKETAERLKDWLRAAYPEFDDFTVEPAFGAMGKVALRWHDNGLSRDLWPLELSDGVLRFLCLATALIDPLPPSLVVVDEPEVGLHPKLLPIVADMLKAAAEETQVLVATHSPDLLNRFDLDDVAVMAREGNRVRWHRPSSRPTLRTLLEGVEGETLGDLHRSGELEAKA
jgi:predicted ATPase